jgi:hypothetical protein
LQHSLGNKVHRATEISNPVHWLTFDGRLLIGDDKHEDTVPELPIRSLSDKVSDGTTIGSSTMLSGCADLFLKITPGSEGWPSPELPSRIQRLADLLLRVDCNDIVTV